MPQYRVDIGQQKLDRNEPLYTGINSMCSYGGVIYGSDDSGVYQFDADGDEKTLIFRWNKIGFTSMFTPSNFFVFPDEVVDYWRLDEEDSGKLEQMNLEILGGNAPDILFGDSRFMNFPVFALRDVLADLQPMMEADADFNREDYADILFETVDSDNRIFYLFTDYTVQGLFTKKENLAHITSWTKEDYGQFVNAFAETVRTPMEISKSGLLEMMFSGAQHEFVDVEMREARFISESFADILEFCDRYGVSDSFIPKEMEFTPSEEILYEEYLFNRGRIQYIQSWADDWGFSDNNLALVNFPMRNRQSVDEGLVAFPEYLMGISEKSPHKDVAWDFIKFLLSEGLQKESALGGGRGIPVRESAVDYAIEIAKEYQSERRIPLSDEGVAELERILGGVSGVSIYNENILNVVLEEAQMYFAGQRSIEKTQEVIQDRVMTYLNSL